MVKYYISDPQFNPTKTTSDFHNVWDNEVHLSSIYTHWRMASSWAISITTTPFTLKGRHSVINDKARGNGLNSVWCK